MKDFLLELRCEEIPARMQAGARAELERLFAREMKAAGVSVGEITIWSTPRRLALIARDLPSATAAVSAEVKGPPQGAPDQAVDGFCRKNGVSRDQLELREVKGRATWFAVIETPGRSTAEVLAAAIPAIIRDFSWPKSMRWGEASISTESIRWVRPLSGIVALLGEELVECEVHGVTSGWVTLGHRFHHSGDITIGSADDYAGKLRACHVIVDHAEREAIIREGAAKAAADAGLVLVEDEGLVVENAGLTEWPVPLLGRFDPDFLEVPPEVIQLSARTNQKYFVCHDANGRLANAFVCTANIEAEDGGAAIVDGNRKVLAARLSDARFFWQQDRRKSLAEHAEGLERITFHEKLGTLADKAERVAKLARWLVEEGIVKGADPDEVELAAKLCKADLVTEMVGEFPELQGVMGGYYARAEGLPDAAADAIRDHYKPVGQGDEVPTAPVTVAVSLADKLDTLFLLNFVGERATGTRDPFALRRTSLGILSTVQKSNLRLKFDRIAEYTKILLRTQERFKQLSYGASKEVLNAVLDEAWPNYPLIENYQALKNRLQQLIVDDAAKSVIAEEVKEVVRVLEVTPEVLKDESERVRYFAIDRLKVQQREAGVRHDLIDAVFATKTKDGGNEDDLVRLLARVKALQNFIETEDGANLLAAYKRAANILKKEDWQGEGSEMGSEESQGISRTGEEDPLALVDDPDLGPVIAAKMRERHARGPSYEPEPAEGALIEALDKAEPEAAAAVAAENFEAAMASLASLRGPIDRFFDEVTVNDQNASKRAARLGLLARFHAAVHNVADFSKIEG